MPAPPKLFPVDQKGSPDHLITDMMFFAGYPPSYVRQDWTMRSRPTDQRVLEAYAQNPWAHQKFLKQCAAVADVPFRVKVETRDRQGRALPFNHPLWTLLRMPNPAMDDWDFRFLTELYILLTGEVYWWPAINGLGVPSQIRVLPRMWVAPQRDANTGRVREYQVTMPDAMSGQKISLPPTALIWLYMPDPISPYTKGLGDAISLATEIESFELWSESDKNFAANDAIPPGAIVTPPGSMPTDTEIKRMKADWIQQHGGQNKGTIAVLSGGADFKQFRESRAEMEFVRSQEYLRDVIISGVHKHVMGIADDVNRANAEAAEYSFARWQVRTRIRWLQRKINRHLAPLFDPRCYVDFDDPVPEDKAARAQEALSPHAMSAMTVDERRKRLGFEPIGTEKGGDMFFMPIGLIGTRDPGELQGASLPAAPKPQKNPEQLPKPPEKTPAAPKRGLEEGVVESGDTALSPSREATRKALSLQELLALLPDFDGDTLLLLGFLFGAYEFAMRKSWEFVATLLRFDQPFNPDNPRVAQFLRSEAARRIQRVNLTTREAIRRTLAEGVEKNESTNQLTRRVSTVFRQAKTSRAEMIATTETTLAMNTSAYEVYRVLGVDVEWMTAPDYDAKIDGGRCDINGEVQPVGKAFSNGFLVPPAHPRCRCVVLPTEQRRASQDTHDAWFRLRMQVEREVQRAVKRGLQDQESRILRRFRAEKRAS